MVVAEMVLAVTREDEETLLVLVVLEIGQRIAVSGTTTQDPMIGVFGSDTGPTQGIHLQRWKT